MTENKKSRGVLFGTRSHQVGLPVGYHPRRPRRLHVECIYLAKGSLATPERQQFVTGICELYPKADIIQRLDTPHNRITLGESDPFALHQAGKKTLVFGQHKSAVRRSEEEGNTCPNYWHFSPYGFCPYDCEYCYLAGTPGVWYSPTVKIYVNLPEIVAEIAQTAYQLGKPTAFYLGKLQDGLALDPLTGYSTVLVPFFAGHRFARQIVLTKSAESERLVGLEHGGNTTLSWSVNPPEVAEQFEKNTPTVEDRLVAMRRCADAGYPIRAVLMPIIPVAGWKSVYATFVQRLLETVPLRRLTLGGICSYKHSRWLMERKLGPRNLISRNMQKNESSGDGRTRYPHMLRAQLYRHIIAAAREVRSDIPLALCLEELAVWKTLNLQDCLGRCNCVL